MRFGLWGDEDMVDVRLAKIRRRSSAIPGAEVLETRYTGEQIAAHEISRAETVHAGIPNLDVKR